MISTILTILTTITPTPAHAARVKSTTATKALIELRKNESVKVGETLYVRDQAGKQKAVLVVTNIREKQVLAEIRSGNVNEGDETNVQAQAPKLSASKQEAAVDSSPNLTWTTALAIGLVLQEVDVTSNSTASMQGPSIAVRAGLLGPSTPFLNFLGWEAGLGVDYVSTSGNVSTNVCDGSRDCSYSAFGLTPFGRFTYDTAIARIKAGLDLYVPVSVTSNVIDDSPFSPVLSAAAGLEWTYLFAKTSDSPLSIPFGVEFKYDFSDAGLTSYRVNFLIGYTWP